MTEASSVFRSKAFQALKFMLALLLLGIAILCLVYWDYLREYRLYFTHTRPAVSLEFTEISEDWTEQDVKRRFSHLKFECYANDSEETPGERTCFADIDYHNKIPALNIFFFFSKDKVNNVAVHYPWWKHSLILKQLAHKYGPPKGLIENPQKNGHIIGWKLYRGDAIFINLRSSINPLMWTNILWSSPRFCTSSPCFIEKKREFGKNI